MEILQPLGLGQAAALARDPSITMARWHEMALAKGDNPPGRIWEQLAAELIIANIQQKTWAWAEPQSMKLLDFWANLDNSIRFLLIAETPGQAILRHIGQTPTATVDDILAQWLQDQQKLLHFWLRQSDRSLLVWRQSIEQAPQKVAQHLCQQWSLDWQPHTHDKASTDHPCPLETHLAEYACRQNIEVQQFLSELQACMTPIADADHLEIPQPLQLLERYTLLQSQALQAQSVPKLTEQLQQSQRQNAHNIASLQAAQQEAANQEARHQQLLAEQQSAHQKEQDKAQTELQQTLKKERDAAQAELQQAIKKEKEAAQAELQQALNKEKEKAHAELTQSHQQQLTLQSQVHDLQTRQKELELQLAQARESAKEVGSLQQRLAALDKQLQTAQAQTAEMGKVQDQLQATQQRLQGLEQQNAEAQEEAQTLLLQLHETQEELESYCIQNEELEQHSKALGQLQKRWGELFENHRNLYAVESLQLEAQADEPTAFRVLCEQLHMGGRYLPQLHATIRIEADGCASIALQRLENDSGPLQRWPTFCAPGDDLVLHPGSGTDTPPKRIAAFLQLTSSDWLISQNLPRLLLAALDHGLPHLNPTQNMLLQTGLQRYLTESKAYSGICRFDSAHVLKVPNAEELALQIDKLSMDAISAPQLSLCLENQAEVQTLVLQPNAWIPTDDTLRLQVNAQGWLPSQTETLQGPPLQRIHSLLEALPLALMDAVHNGADKAALKPWAETLRQMRKNIHNPARPGTQAPAAKSARSKLTAKTKTKTQAPAGTALVKATEPKPKTDKLPPKTASANAPSKNRPLAPSSQRPSRAKAHAAAPKSTRQKVKA